MSKKAKTDKRKNPEYDEPQSIYVEGADPDEQLRKLLEIRPDDKASKKG